MKKKILVLISVLILLAIGIGVNISNKEISNFNATKSQANVETTIEMTNQGLMITANGLVANNTNTQIMKNNTDYLQKCIDQVSEKGGGTVHIPAGKYYFAAQDTVMRNGTEFSQYVIKLKNNVLIEGEGNSETSGTILRPQGETKYGLDMFYYNEYADSKYTKATYLENADFKGFIIDAQGAVGQNYNKSGNGFMINLFMDCEWNNVTVKNTDGTGFAISGPINSTIKNSIAIGCGKKATIEDEGASGFGIGVGYSNKEYIYINSCEANNNKKYGFVFEHQARYGEGNYTATKSDGFVVTDSKATGNKYDFGGKSSYDVLYENCTSGYGEKSNTNTVRAYDFKEEKSVRTNIRKANYTADYTDIDGLNKQWINWLSENGITFRFKGTEFWPDTELSRAQALLWLYRHSGRPGEVNLSEINSTEKSKTGFSDIDNDETLIKDEELKAAIKWAISKTIIDGPSDGNTTFRPDEGITKRELIIMLWKYTGGYVLGDNVKFADCNDDEQLQNALDWGVWAEIVEWENNSTKFEPNNVYTRDEGLKWMYLCEICFTKSDGSVGAWITYHLQGGNTKLENPTSYRDPIYSKNPITLNNPTKEGYTFEGWIGKSYTTDENSITYCKPLTTITHDQKEYGNKIYTAIWNPNTYSITFNANGGTGEMEQQYFTYDNPQAILKNSLTKEECVFVGWNTASNGSGTSYTDGQVVKNLTSTANETITLYAQWEQKVVDKTVKYKVEQYKQNVDDDEYTLESTSELSTKLGETVTIPTMEYEGFTSPEVKAVKITEENQIIKYYYTRNSYKIIIEKGKGIENVTVNPSGKETFKYGSTVRLVAIPKAGYGNGKWSTGEIDKADVLVPAKDVTMSVYADIKNYNITYNLNGGTVEGNPNKYTVEAEDIKLKNPTKEGYTFLGWIGSNGETPQKDVTIKKGTTEDLQFIANWGEVIKYKVEHYKQNIENDEYTLEKNTEQSIVLGETVTIPVMEYEGFTSPEVKTVKITEENQIIKYYYTRNLYKIIIEKGKGIESVTVNPSGKETFKYGSTVRLVAIPKAGYGNGKWSTGEIEKADVVVPANDVTMSVYAEIKNYNIAYNLNGGTAEGNPKTYTVETESIKLKRPTKEGYVFLGWTGSNGETPQKDVTIEKGTTEDLQFTANWGNLIEYKVEHYKQNIENNDYTIAETISENGEIGEKVTPNTMTYEGFTSPETKTEELKTDGQIIKYYYTRNSYNITITKGTGIESVSNNTQYKYGEKVSLQAILKDGYGGAKWTGEYESNEFTMPAKNIQMSVSANLIEYDIKYNLNGGTVEGNPKAYTIETESITLKNPTRVGHTFLGWTGSNGETPQKDVTIEKGTVGNLQFTANWQEASAEKPNNLEVEISYSTKELTNQDVTVIISTNNKIKEVKGWKLSEDKKSISKIYEQNGSENVIIIDEYGNEKEQLVEVNNIDKIPPEVEITYEEKDGYVIAIAKTNEKVREVDGWKLSEDKQELTKIYYENKEEKVTYTDLAGNETEKLVKINSIKETDGDNEGDNNNDDDDNKGSIDITGGNKSDSTTSDKQLPAAGMKFVIWIAIGCISICIFLFIKVKKYNDI